jgi:hypothetical protein
MTTRAISLSQSLTFERVLRRRVPRKEDREQRGQKPDPDKAFQGRFPFDVATGSKERWRSRPRQTIRKDGPRPNYRIVRGKGRTHTESYLIRGAQRVIESIEALVRLHNAQEEDIYEHASAVDLCRYEGHPLNG